MQAGSFINTNPVMDQAQSLEAHGYSDGQDLIQIMSRHMHEHSHKGIIIFVAADVWPRLCYDLNGLNEIYSNSVHASKYTGYVGTHRNMPIISDINEEPSGRYLSPNSITVGYYPVSE